MKRLLLTLILLAPLAGCAWFGKQIDYAKLCQQDPACLFDAKQDSQLVSMIVQSVYPPAAGAAGAAVLTLSLWYRGKRKKVAK